MLHTVCWLLWGKDGNVVDDDDDDHGDENDDDGNNDADGDDDNVDDEEGDGDHDDDGGMTVGIDYGQWMCVLYILSGDGDN